MASAVTESMTHTGPERQINGTAEMLNGCDIALLKILRLMSPVERHILLLDVPLLDGVELSGGSKTQQEWNARIRGLISEVSQHKTRIHIQDISPAHHSSSLCWSAPFGTHQSGLSQSFLWNMGSALQEIYPKLARVEIPSYAMESYTCGYHNSLPDFTPMMGAFRFVGIRELKLGEGKNKEFVLGISVFKSLGSLTSLEDLELDGVTVRNPFSSQLELSCELQDIFSPRNFPAMESVQVRNLRGIWRVAPNLGSLTESWIDEDSWIDDTSFEGLASFRISGGFLTKTSLERVPSEFFARSPPPPRERSMLFGFRSFLLNPDAFFGAMRDLRFSPAPRGTKELTGFLRNHKRIQSFHGTWMEQEFGSVGCEDVFWALMDQRDLREAKIVANFRMPNIVGLYGGPRTEAFAAQRLQKLSLVGEIFWCYDDILKKLADSCPELHTLSIATRSPITLPGWTHLSRLLNLRRLRVGLLDGADAVVPLLASCGEHLEVLWVGGLTRGPSVGWCEWADGWMGHVPGLKVLDLSAMVSVSSLDDWKRLAFHLLDRMNLEVIAAPTSHIEYKGVLFCPSLEHHF